MHDPTEGGFLGGLSEICRLSGMSANIDSDSVPIHEYTLRASKSLGFNSMRLVASGSMIAVVPDKSVGDVMDAFRDLPIAMTMVGSIDEAGDAGGTPDMLEAGEEIWALLKRGKDGVA
jgi:hydrogenase maturation factor